MSIRFVCTCGKHLRAREDMASRRTVCPACGRPVGIPSLQPTQRGTEADPASLAVNQPLVPPIDDVLRYHVVPVSESRSAVEHSDPLTYHVVPLQDDKGAPDPSRQPRSLEARYGDPPDGPPVPDISLSALHLLPTKSRTRERRRREKWGLEKYWFQCLGFPLRARALLAWLSIAVTILLGTTVFEIPRFLDLEPGGRGLWFVWTLLPIVVIGYLCGFWHCVMCSAVFGEAGFVRWPGKDLRIVLEGMVRCIVCFLAGPAILVVAAFYLWLEGGDLQWIDRLLLAELIVVAAGYWLLAFIAVSEGDSLRYVLPLHVLRVFRRLGYRAVVGVLLFALLITSHGAWAVVTLTELHVAKFSGWFFVWCCVFSGLFWTTFLMRWLGVRSFLSRVETAFPRPQPVPA